MRPAKQFDNEAGSGVTLWVQRQGMENKGEATAGICYRPPGLEKREQKKILNQLSKSLQTQDTCTHGAL